MRSLAALVCLVLVASASAQTATPRGDWVGTWKSTTGSSGYLAISVDDVQGETVRGSLYMAVTAPDTQGYYNRDVRFTGGFDGTTMRITVQPSLFFAMTVTREALRGTVYGQHTNGTIDLARRPPPRVH